MKITERDPDILIPETNRIEGGILAKCEVVSRELARELPSQNVLIDNILREISRLVREASRFLLSIPGLPLPENLPPSDRSLTNLTLHVNKLQRQLNRWGTVEALVRLQNPMQVEPLYARQLETHKSSFTQARASDTLFIAMHNLLRTPEQSEAASQHGCFADIPLNNSEFFQHIQAARRVLLARDGNARMRFLDVGCGIGIKVLAATQFFDDAVGLEYDESYIPLAQGVVDASSTGNGSVIHGDGLVYENYDQFDCIYFFRPMKDDDLLLQLEQVIADNARPETVLIAPYEMYSNRHEKLGVSHIDGGLYLAKSNQGRADELRQKAERTGNAPRYSDPVRFPIWDPILLPSAKRGYQLPRT